MKKEKAETRVRVERVLRENSSPTNPLTCARIAEMSRVNLTLVRHYVGKLIGMKLIYNTGKRSTSAYVWRVPVAVEVKLSVSRISSIPYKGEKAGYVRESGKAFLLVPSRRGDSLTDYTAPIFNGGSQA